MVHDIRRGLDFDDTIDPDDVLPEGYDVNPCGQVYVQQLQETNRRLRAERDAAVAALEAVEYVPDPERPGCRICWWCKRNEPEHADDCQRQAALGKEGDDG